MIFLARHGQPHRIAPHLINYRANVWLMRELGATMLLATNAVGSIADAMAPGDLMLPHQIIDYTWGRSHTYMDTLPLQHVDFTAPYDAALRDRLRARRSNSNWTARCSMPVCTDALKVLGSKVQPRSTAWLAMVATWSG